ncbi:MAG: M3 family metallopeptidase [Prevotellaceae bacterium]|nr:M3 family metallopeptidase [Prevotellaceae bacterium]
MNALLSPFSTPYETYPFDSITVENIEEAIRVGIAEHNEEIERIVSNAEKPTFHNTIVPFEKSGMLLDRASTLMYNLLSAETNADLEALSQRVAPVLSDHASDVFLHAALFKRISLVYASEQPEDAEDAMLLKEIFESFERAGAGLDESEKMRLRKINAELAELSLKFSQNLLKETNAYTLHITDEADLSGLPASQREVAAMVAEERGMKGWVFTLHAPSYGPFMMYADNRELRHDMYMAYATRCTKDNNENNLEIVRCLVNLRREKANILGFSEYADYVLQRRMARSKKKVYELLDCLAEAYRPMAEKEVAAVQQYAPFPLQAWDFAYYAQKRKQKEFAFDPEELRPYLELSNVKRGVFGLATRLYGVTFRKNPSIPVYHKDVTAYEVYDEDGRMLAVLYCDFHPRPSKQGGAWMTNYREASSDNIPHVSVVMNFTRATETTPALLTLDEVETLLHEFGHALHGIFASTRYSSLSGTNVLWDFVELPSQFMENYAVEPDFLSTFAFHYQTGECIPAELIARVCRVRNYNVAYACLRQLSFGYLDMAFYTLQEPLSTDLIAFERAAMEPVRLLPVPESTCMAAQFSHIMSGGYAAGYYSYKWAEVLDADAFEVFREHGIFDRTIASRFRSCILSRGGTCPPDELYRAFKGTDPTIDALLRRNGINAISTRNDK